METKTKKGNMITVAIIAVVAVIVAGIIIWILLRKNQTPLPQAEAQPIAGALTSDNIANWKTYTNEKLNFEVKYPPNWFAVENDAENRIYFQNISQDNLKKPYPNNLRMVWISYDQNESNEANFLITNSPEAVKYQIDANGIEINAYEDSVAETSEIFTDAFWKYNDQLYSASTLGGEFATANIARKAEAEQNKILREMLSTLKFTK
jgi:hypothetical protein